MSDRFECIIKYFIDMQVELQNAGIDASNETIATLVAADVLRSLNNSIEYQGI